MSYDLMVFEPAAAPKERADFLAWYDRQTQWTETHGYNDPNVTTASLRAWYDEMGDEWPNMNGPDMSDDDDSPKLTDYSIGESVIYVAFAWSEAENAYSAVRKLAEKHQVGFYDVSSDDGEILIFSDRDKSSRRSL